MENGEEQTELEQEAKELLNTITDAIKHFLYLSYSINSMLENKLPQKDIDFFKEAYNRHFFLMMKYSQLDKEFYYDAINCKVVNYPTLNSSHKAQSFEEGASSFILGG
jgi:hypothetical protein